MAMDLNMASERELLKLPGVGQVIAKRIVAARPFTALVQLRQITGIGPKRFDALVGRDPLVTIGEVPTATSNGRDGTKCGVKTESTKSTKPPASVAQRRKPTRLVDLNRATLGELVTLHGVGPKLAQRIVDARPFRRRDEVTAVRGIGLLTYEKMQHQLLEIRGSVTSYGTASSEDGEEEEDSAKENEPQAASPTRRPLPSTRPPLSISPRGRSSSARPPRRRRSGVCDMPSRTLLGAIRASVLPHSTTKLLIASWNIRNLSKRKDAEPLHVIADILQQFDIVAIQEARDTIVLRRLKHFMPGWDYIASPLVGAHEVRVGTGAAAAIDGGASLPTWRRRAEHFAFFFRRRCLVPVLPTEDTQAAASSFVNMVRPPFVATFQTIGTAMPSLQFALVNVHIVCGDMVSKQREMNELWRLATRLPQSKNLMVVGDFNLAPQDVDGMGAGDSALEPLILSPLATTVGDKLLDNIWLHGAGDWDTWEMESGVYRIDWALYPRTRALPRPHETQRSRLAAQAARVECKLDLSDHCPVFVAIGDGTAEED